MSKGKFHPYSKHKTIHCDDTGETVSGDNYLASKHWKNMRIPVYDHYKGVCQRCGSNIPLDVAHIHHRVYKRMGREKISDLVLYCNNCHACVHKNKKEQHETNRNLNSLISSLTLSEKLEAYDILTAHFDFDVNGLESAKNKEQIMIDERIETINDHIYKLKKELKKLKREKETNDEKIIS